MKDNSDLLLFLGALGVCLLLLVIAYDQFDRHRNRRPYLAARWDDKAGDWVNEHPHDVGPDPLKLIVDLERELKAYAATVADLYDPIRDEDDHTTNPTGD